MRHQITVKDVIEKWKPLLRSSILLLSLYGVNSIYYYSFTLSRTEETVMSVSGEVYTSSTENYSFVSTFDENHLKGNAKKGSQVFVYRDEKGIIKYVKVRYVKNILNLQY